MTGTCASPAKTTACSAKRCVDSPACAAIRARRRALQEFDDRVGSRTADLRKMAEDAYVTGQASILELIDAVQVRYDLQLERAELLEEVVHAEVEVLHVTGRIEETFP